MRHPDKLSQKLKRRALPIATLTTTALMAVGCGGSSPKHRVPTHRGSTTSPSEPKPSPTPIHRPDTTAEAKQHRLVGNLQQTGLKAAKSIVNYIMMGDDRSQNIDTIGVFPRRGTETEAIASYTEGYNGGEGTIYADSLRQKVSGKSAGALVRATVLLDVEGSSAATMDTALASGRLSGQDFAHALNGDVTVDQASVSSDTGDPDIAIGYNGYNTLLYSQGSSQAGDLKPLVRVTASNADRTIGPFLVKLESTSTLLTTPQP